MKRVSNEKLLQDLQRVAREWETEACTIARYKTYGKYSISTYVSRFGSWNESLTQASLKVSRETNISDNELLQDLQEVARELGQQTVTTTQYKIHGKYSDDTHIERFGSWNESLTQAGLRIYGGPNISDNELLQDLQEVARELGQQTVTITQYKTHGKYSHDTYAERFGSWNEALAQASLMVTVETNISDNELLQDLQRVARELGQQTVTTTQYKIHGKYSDGTYLGRFDSWNKALEQAGLIVSFDPNISESKLIEDLRKVASELGVQTVAVRQYRLYGKYSFGVYVRRFGSWNQALQRADLKIFGETSIPLTTELLLPHADTLSLVLRTLRSTHTDLSSDDLWQAIKANWSEQDLAEAIKTFQAGEDLSSFHGLLDDR